MDNAVFVCDIAVAKEEMYVDSELFLFVSLRNPDEETLETAIFVVFDLWR